MTQELRDTFAAAALTGLLVHANDGIDEETLDTPSDIAYTAYSMADAMLRERGSVRDSRTADTANHDAEPMAWAVMQSDSDYCVTLSTRKEAAKKAAERKVEVGEYATMDDIVIVPLYRRPQPTLTEAERGAVEVCAHAAENCNGFGGDPTRPAIYEGRQVAATLRGLLERTR